MFEISQKSLDNLNNLKFEELILKKKESDLRNLIDVVTFITFVIIYVILSVFLIKLVVSYFVSLAKDSYCLIVIPIFFLLCFASPLIELYERIFNHFYQRSQISRQIKDLDFRIEMIEHGFEKTAINLLAKTEIEMRNCSTINRTIYAEIKQKRKWRASYEGDLNTVKENCETIDNKSKIIKQYLQYIKLEKEKAKHFQKVEKEFSNPYWHYNWLHNKLETLYDRNSSNQESRSKDSKNVNLSNKTKSKNILEQQIDVEYENPQIYSKEVSEIPTKGKTPKFERIIKVSSEYYLKVADKNMKVGRKGELFVMEYEKQKLLSMGRDFQKKLKHVSVEEGDGYGYDILSFEEDKEIFIEVKTTTGSFWSNLFFTQNEFNKMKIYKEQYYLYRICNFNLDTSLGDLFIFKGEEMIEAYFDFASKMYVLTQKSN